MTALEVDVVLDARGIWATVGPYRTRGLCTSVDARPVWRPLRKAWSISYRHGLDVIALAEHLGRRVNVRTEGTPRPEPVVVAAPVKPEATLW